MPNGDSTGLDADFLKSLQIPVTGTTGASQIAPLTLEQFAQLFPQQQLPQAQQQQEQIQQAGKGVASVRYNNPGAMWPSPSSQKFGSTSYGVIGGGNRIANFPDPVSGAAAQFDLLNSRKYIGRPVADLIDEWSGHTGGSANVYKYAKQVADAAGISVNDRLTPELLQGPAGIAFAKAQARMEAGGEYPLTDAEWTQAQQRAFGGAAQVAQANQQR